MLSPDTVRSLAVRLEKAESEKRCIGLFSAEFPEITVEDAYAIQRAWLDIKIHSGRTAIGYKVGLTSKAMQRSAGTNEPNYGFLLDTMLFKNGAEIPKGHYITPRVEVELAFILKKNLSGPKCTALALVA